MLLRLLNFCIIGQDQGQQVDGDLPGFKIGDSWRFDMDEVIESIKAKKGTIGVRTTLTRRIKKHRERKVREGWKK